MKRFWKKADVRGEPEGYYILLDGRKLKTPEGKPVVIPRNKHLLAYLVAGEWESQEKNLKSYSLPLTSLVVRSIDSFSDPSIRQGVIDNLLRYCHTDSVCYFQDYPDSFVKAQNQYWRTVVQWVETEYNVKVTTTDGIMSARQSPDTVAQLRSIIEGFDNLSLAAFERAVLHSKSFFLALALLSRKIDCDFAARAARLEVWEQIRLWGEVEDSHDLDEQEMKRQLGAATCAALLQ
ncbi:uncharacterized protein BJ171DRAFT_557705 [Polychytrium aggregatum]|uniref:uncharacterized protein n=1 Tax=Polychytrium aggregatum TaxID=110093 RepID=UPI0022FE2865|nr:uncharacterized protein BJ171DRAFT_560513 [Polychytrium aggregatum]XP_052970496.1 uncharacterized protein BJ171DRAFT_557705 [Polychytrium aggregatum]KAI9190595.1 hypothetical protein BJ171DRAFT_560513 [Polychytrium aggregatum]KAI9208416.1 hypothetical protein BJ171DRAFT_557705 [Polychytrium aggregatum]